MMFMKTALHELPYLENWRWLSRRIRCALEPDEPRVIDHYLAEGRYLVCCTDTSAWTVALTSFRLLLDTACDRMLPWHWRCICLDQAWRPLLQLRTLDRREYNDRWQPYATQLATCVLLPSISSDELMQGHDDE
ncbi:FagA protein [Pseudomonas alabamensis]|uniref:FagA protein n=1 Tax=Pseudomonas alabamensis TaxID=3064349 RepID=UPI0011A838DD